MTQGYTRWTSRLAAASSFMTIPRSQTGSGSQAPLKIRPQLRRPVKQPAQPMLFWTVCQRNGSCRPCAAASRHCVHCCEQQRCDPCCCPVVYCDRHYQPFAISPFANPLVACSQHVPLHVRPHGAAAPSLPAPTQDRFLRRGAYHVLFRTIAAVPVHVPPHGHAPPARMRTHRLCTIVQPRLAYEYHVAGFALLVALFNAHLQRLDLSARFTKILFQTQEILLLLPSASASLSQLSQFFCHLVLFVVQLLDFGLLKKCTTGQSH